MKEKIKRMIFTVVLVVITMILSTILSVYATTTILGSEVGYTDNKGIGASNVQAAIDNTYSSALSLDSRVTTLEGSYIIKKQSCVDNVSISADSSSTQYFTLTESAYTPILASCFVTNATTNGIGMSWTAISHCNIETSSRAAMIAYNISRSNTAKVMFCANVIYKKNY